MFSPCASRSFPFKEPSAGIGGKRKTVVDLPQLSKKMIKRNGNIAGIAHNVNHGAVAGIKTFVAFNQARTGELSIVPVLELVDVGRRAFDALESDRASRIQKVPEQEPCPGVSGFEVGDQKDIIGANGNAPLVRLISTKHVAQEHLKLSCHRDRYVPSSSSSPFPEFNPLITSSDDVQHLVPH